MVIKLLKRFTILILLLLAILFPILLYNTFTLNDRQNVNINDVLFTKISQEEKVWVDTYTNYLTQLKYQQNHNSTLINLFSKFVQFKTISYHNLSQVDWNEFEKQEQFIIESFPTVFSTLERIKIDDDPLSKNFIFLKWQGTSSTLLPFLLASHSDVVPIAPNTEHLWSTDPFSGEVIDNFVYGRGALDDKSGVFGILATLEALLKADPKFQPRRTLYIAFGHDEECLGALGAGKAKKYLLDRNIRLEYVLDEGGSIFDKLPPLIEKPIALVATAEKGIVTFNLTVVGDGGHSSMPPNETPIGILSKAINRLESTQLPKAINGAFKEMLEFISSNAIFPVRLVTSNLWFFSYFLTSINTDSTTINASIRTTVAPTVFIAGEKDNVLPKVASAMVNFRILPGDNSKILLKRVSDIINDKRVEISILNDDVNEPSPVSPTDSFGWKILQATIADYIPGIIVTPYLALGATDGRYYYDVTDNVYRFAPASLTQRDLTRIHGIDERLHVDDIIGSVEFYGKLILYSQFEVSVSNSPRHPEL